jgi:hypothetical protein
VEQRRHARPVVRLVRPASRGTAAVDDWSAHRKACGRAHLGLEAPVLSERDAAGGLRDLVALARPRQWVKNAVCFAALVFAGLLDDERAVALAAVTFVAFCFASSAVYVLNDVLDRAEDRAHPVKRRRPVAAGRVSVGTALAESAVLAVAAVATCSSSSARGSSLHLPRAPGRAASC